MKRITCDAVRGAALTRPTCPHVQSCDTGGGQWDLRAHQASTPPLSLKSTSLLVSAWLPVAMAARCVALSALSCQPRVALWLSSREPLKADWSSDELHEPLSVLTIREKNATTAEVKVFHSPVMMLSTQHSRPANPKERRSKVNDTYSRRETEWNEL